MEHFKECQGTQLLNLLLRISLDTPVVSIGVIASRCFSGVAISIYLYNHLEMDRLITLMELCRKAHALPTRAVQPMLAGGGSPPTAEETAQSLHMSVRTLHRNLRAEDTAFSDLFNQLRRARLSNTWVTPGSASRKRPSCWASRS